MKVFISYRRDDSIIHARLIRNELVKRFGERDVFMDIDDIVYGDDFAQKINQHIDDADVVVAVIGPQWADMLARRAHGDDYVRHELARSLAMRKRVIPVLIGKAEPPGAGLPADLDGLRLLNGLRIEERSLKAHLNELIEAVRGESFEDESTQLRRLRRAQWCGAALGLTMFFAAWLTVLDFAGLDTRFASATMWLSQFGTTAPWSGEVVLVPIDEATVRHVGRGFDTSWRREHARVVRQLSAAGAKTIAFDLFVEREGTAADDGALEAAILSATATPVVFAVGSMEGNRPRLLPRFAAIAAGGIACGGVKFDYARSMPLAIQRGQLMFPSFALAAFSGGGKVEGFDERNQEVRVRVVQDDRSPDVGFASAETNRLTDVACDALRQNDRVALQWFDPALTPRLEGADRRVPYERVLDAGSPADLAQFKGKIVLVGLTLANQDVFSLPRAGSRWGVELHAEQVDALVRGETIRPMGFGASLALMIGLGVAGGWAHRAFARRSFAVRSLVVAGGVVACTMLAVLTYRVEHVLVNLPYACLAFVLSWWVVARIERRGAS